jgi:hypothetical protein
MSRNFDLDPTAAKEANSGGKRITEPGAYTGKFKAAFYEANANGTESVNLLFVADNGQEVGPLALYTHKGDGTELPSYKTLHAILACARVRKLEAKPGRVSLYDFDSQKDVEKEKLTYPALVGPRIGLVLQGEEYENRKGEIKTRMVIGAPFCAESKRMAEEVLTSAQEAKALDKYLSWFEQHKVKPIRNGSVRQPASRDSGPPAYHSEFNDFDNVDM